MSLIRHECVYLFRISRQAREKTLEVTRRGLPFCGALPVLRAVDETNLLIASLHETTSNHLNLLVYLLQK